VKVKELKTLLYEGLDHLETFYGDRSVSDLRKSVDNTSNPTTLFRMLQIFREALKIEDTSFKVSLKDGTVKVFNNLKEADEYFGGNKSE